MFYSCNFSWTCSIRSCTATTCVNMTTRNRPSWKNRWTNATDDTRGSRASKNKTPMTKCSRSDITGQYSTGNYDIQ